MALNLADIYATLLRKHGEQLSINYGPAPTYLSKIIGKDIKLENKIIFMFKENRCKSNDYITPIKLQLQKTHINDEELIGSPLKDDCVVDAIDVELLNNDLKSTSARSWRPDEEYHRGIDLDAARAIICSEDFQLCDDKAQGSIWLLCNAADAERTLMLQYEHSSKCFSRGLINFMGIIYPHELSVPNMLQQHNFLRSNSTARLETNIENTYQFTPNIIIRCAWSSISALPSLIDLSLCDVTLMQKFQLCDCGQLTQNFINQLRILTLLRDDIISYKQAQLGDAVAEPIYRCGRGIDMDDLRDSIIEAITDISAPFSLETGSDMDNQLEAVLERASMRPLNDLTDKMWDILKCCASYKNLKLGFNYLFQYTARCNVVNMPTNKNRLAEIITEVANGRLAIPCLTGSEPLELLLEIGLDKLQKDYEFIFNESKLCNTSLLQYKNLETLQKEEILSREKVRKSLRNAVRPDAGSGLTTRKTLLKTHSKTASEEEEFLAGFKYSNFDEQETAARLAKLLQVHCTLEHLLLMHTQLNLSNVSRAVCEELLNKPAQFMSNIEETYSNDMEIALSVIDVREHLEEKEPHSRRIHMKSGNKFRELESIFFYSMDKICPPAIMDYFDLEDKEVDKVAMYYSWYYRKIKSFH